MGMLFKLAFRNILRQRRRSILTALSMSGGYLLCAFSFSLLDGSYNNIINIFTLDHTGHVQIHKGNYLRRPKIHLTIDEPTQISRLLDQDPEVMSHTLRVFAPALAYSDKHNAPAQVIGVDLEREKTTSRLAQKVTDGEFITSTANPDGYYSAMIGAGIANALKIGVNDEIILISQGADGSIANDIYLVGGIIGNRNSLDKANVFLPLGAAQEFLSMPGQVHEVAMVLENESKAQTYAADLQRELTDLTVSPWQEVESSFYKTMESDKKSNHATLGIVIFIVFIGVLNTVLMSVLERTREFGVLKAIGSRPITIASLITLETVTLSIISIAIGFVLSLPLIAWFSEYGISLSEPVDLGGIAFDSLKGEMSLFVFGTPMLLILGFAIAVSIPPGIRAAGIAPTKAMGSH